jgi:cystathionine beta-lyase
MKYHFDRLHPRQHTGSIKWEFIAEDGVLRERAAGPDPLAADELLPMWIADMDFPTPQPVIDALVGRLNHGIIGYTQTTDAYEETIVGWFQRRHGWRVARDWIVTTPGVMQSVSLLVQTFTRPGDGIIVQPPLFRPLSNAVTDNERLLISNPLRYQDGRYSMDLEDLSAKAADPRASMMLLCNPHNPVGRAWTRDELREVGEICKQNDILIVCDEIHGDLTYPWAKFTPFGAIDERFRGGYIVCNGASKPFNLPGLRTSLTFIPEPALRERFLITLRNLNELFCVNTLGTLALQTAYAQGEDWLHQLMAYLEANYRYLEAQMTEHLPRLKVVHPEALYLIWIDCRALGLNQKRLEALFVDQAKVYLESGTNYGSEGAGFMRMNIACPRSILETALKRIRRSIEDLEGK